VACLTTSLVCQEKARWRRLRAPITVDRLRIGRGRRRASAAAAGCEELWGTGLGGRRS